MNGVKFYVVNFDFVWEFSVFNQCRIAKPSHLLLERFGYPVNDIAPEIELRRVIIRCGDVIHSRLCSDDPDPVLRDRAAVSRKSQTS